MYKHLSLSLLLACCTVLPACTCEKESKPVAVAPQESRGMQEGQEVDEETPEQAATDQKAEQLDVTEASEPAFKPELPVKRSSTVTYIESGETIHFEDVVKKLGSEEKALDAILANDAVVIDFFATWCGPCQNLGPKFDRLAAANTSTVFVKVDVDKNEKIAKRYGVRSMPTIIYFKNGKETGNRTVGGRIDEITSRAKAL
jgi:thioredoxin